MTKKQVHELVDAGHPVVIGKYLLYSCEDGKWRDKVTGVRREGVFIRHTVDFGNVAVEVGSFAPDGVKAADVPASIFRQMDEVALLVKGWQVIKGKVTARGDLEKIVSDGPVGGAKTVASGVVR